MTTGMNPINNAVEQALTNDGALQVELGVSSAEPHKVWDTRVPEGTVVTPPLIILGSMLEGPSDVFHRPGATGTLTITVLTAELGKLQAGKLYGHLVRILHRQRLALGGGLGHVDGICRLILSTEDEGSSAAEPIMRTTCAYEYTVRS